MLFLMLILFADVKSLDTFSGEQIAQLYELYQVIEEDAEPFGHF